MVLRSREPLQLVPRLERLRALGLRHVEIAWEPLEGWSDAARQLALLFPDLRLGAASICNRQALEAALAAGLSYGVSPILDESLLLQASAAGFALVPGVMTPSEVNRARTLGCPIVKLFPAVSLGLEYWRRLAVPLGAPLPFCIAAGGLRPGDVLPWLEAGVDAVALGSALGDGAQGPFSADAAEPPMGQLLAALAAVGPGP